MENTLSSKKLAVSLGKISEILLTRIKWRKAQSSIQITLALLILTSAFCLDAFTYFRIGNIVEDDSLTKFKFALYLGTGFSINLFGIFVSNILLRSYRNERIELKSLQEECDNFNKLVYFLGSDEFAIEFNEFMPELLKELFYHCENPAVENMTTDKNTSEMVSAVKEILLKAVAK